MASTPFHVKALFEYTSGHDDDLNFPAGQIITVTAIEDDDWYYGEYDGSSGHKEGIFPTNFVEKYEPVAPPRPSRPRPKSEHAPAPPVEPEPEPFQPEPQRADPAPAAAPEQEPELELEPEPEPAAPEVRAASPSPPQPTAAPPPKSPIAVTPPPFVPKPVPAEPSPVTQAPVPVPRAAEAAPAPPAATKPVPSSAARGGGPPPVAEKPTTSSFRDRIAAFNRPAAAPVTPFKPAGLGSGSGGFIKKPFVAPPPSRNAFIPQAQSAAPPTKIYRREEDPEIRQQEAENQDNAEKAGLAHREAGGSGGGGGEEEEEQPKPMSLKERIAFLQQQQMEQAQRHADVVAKKEKPKRPLKKRVEGYDEAVGEPETPSQGIERSDTVATTGTAPEEEPVERMPLPRRKASKSAADQHIQDGNEADMSGAGDTTEGQDDLTEREEGDEKQKRMSRPPPPPPPTEPPVQRQVKEDDGDDDGAEQEQEGEEDADVDPEVRRKEELRARMAKISGGGMGMGMGGMFGMPMPMMGGPSPGAPKRRNTRPIEEEPREEERAPVAHAPPIPSMMALPGMSRPKPAAEPEEMDEEDVRPHAPPVSSIPIRQKAEEAEEEEDEEEEQPQRRPSQSQHRPPPELPSREPDVPPPVPGGRPAPPPVPSDSRPPPLPPAMRQVSEGSESDDELSEQPPPDHPRESVHHVTRAPPPPPVAVAMPPVPTSPRSPSKRYSYVADDSSPGAPTRAEKRASRLPPPIPGSVPVPPPGASRPPPPPPPGAAPSRSSTMDFQSMSPRYPMRPEGDDEEVTEYEGDYDTDIASSVPHKDALKSHAREPSYDDSTPIRSPTSDGPLGMAPPPPVPTPSAPRAAPPSIPPIPSQPPPPARPSAEMPRSAPPPPPMEAPTAAPPLPSALPPTPRYGDDEYDPYNYSAPGQGIPIPGLAPTQTTTTGPLEEPSYSPDIPSAPTFSPVERRSVGPPPAPSSGRSSHRQSLDMHKMAAQGKRSMDTSRPQADSGYVANDVDLAQYTNWWQQPNILPPTFQGRKDIYYEFEEQTSTTGTQQVVTRDIYILFQDYSQTVITVSFDAKNMTDVEIDQRHEAPPRTLRQDELENAYDQFGQAIADAAKEKKDTVVGDGTPQGLINEVLKPLKSALLPVGTRSYGALVYQNMANASTQLNDQIRPGDIMSIRNAKFQGKHGPMHAKYSTEVGKPDHVGIVAEWDGTKKKVRAWEQGREGQSKKNKIESFKLDDLRSGEVKIWRVMPRAWVNWDDRN